MSEQFKAKIYRLTLKLSAFDIPRVEKLSERAVIDQICDILTDEHYAVIEAEIEEEN